MDFSWNQWDLQTITAKEDLLRRSSGTVAIVAHSTNEVAKVISNSRFICARAISLSHFLKITGVLFGAGGSHTMQKKTWTTPKIEVTNMNRAAGVSLYILSDGLLTRKAQS
jgi:hypothetical protein